MDFRAASDKIWHAELINKLEHMSIPTYIITQVKIGPNIYTESFPCTISTRQGCSLSPTLFNIYLNDLPYCFEQEHCIPTNIDRVTISSLLYADDQGRCDRNFSKVATARGFARGLLALAKCSARCDRNP